MNIRKRQPHAGFTLLELMIASAITTVIGVIAATMLPNMMGNHAQVLKEEKALTRIERALQIVRSDIEQLVVRPLIFPFESAEQPIVQSNHNIVGLETSLEFSFMQSSPTNEKITQKIHRVRYLLQNQQLIRETIATHLPAANQQWSSAVLLENVNSIQFHYLLDRWQTDLADKDKAPKAIRITIDSSHWGNLQVIANITGASA